MMTEEELKDYIAGLFEGDGHVSVAKEEAENQYCPRFNITADMVEKPFLEYLKMRFGYGFIRVKRNPEKGNMVEGLV